MPRFPVDVPKTKAIRTLERLGFRVVREGNHISMVRKNPDGSQTPLTMPNHRRIIRSNFTPNLHSVWDLQSRFSGGLRTNVNFTAPTAP